MVAEKAAVAGAPSASAEEACTASTAVSATVATSVVAVTSVAAALATGNGVSVVAAISVGAGVIKELLLGASTLLSVPLLLLAASLRASLMKWKVKISSAVLGR